MKRTYRKKKFGKKRTYKYGVKIKGRSKRIRRYGVDRGGVRL